MNCNNKYDVVIIGGGIGGLMCAYRIAERDPEASVLLLERGLDLEHRQCPIISGKADKCLKCEPCAVMEGIARGGCILRWQVYHFNGIRRMAAGFHGTGQGHGLY